MPAATSNAETADLRSADATADAASRARMPAWLGSVILHAILFVIAGLAWTATPHGVPNGGDRAAGIALADFRTGQPQYFLSSSISHETSDSAQNAASASSALPSVAATTDSALPGLPAASEATSGSATGIGLPATSDLTRSGQPNQGTAGETSTGVFGAVGTGSKFVYVFDRSASMADLGGRPLAAAKAQLLRSLENLSDIHQFQIVFYNERPHIFNPYAPNAPRLLYGNDQSKRSAEKFVAGITAAGGTQHWLALKLALNLRPDVIFFLTDGTAESLSPGELAQLERSSERYGTSINVIEFGSGSSSGTLFLKRVADRARGQYVYVDVTRLQDADVQILGEHGNAFNPQP